MLNPDRKTLKPEGNAFFADATFDDDGSFWKKIQEGIIERSSHIIALRGAGSKNGIDKVTADSLLQNHLVPRVRSCLDDGPVTIMFDGDADNLEKPDIGYIVGRLRDFFNDDVEGGRLFFFTAQKRSWYSPSKEKDNLRNANGKEYQTVVFPDGKFPGEHNSFTQSRQLANAESYEQWYVGASGSVALEQLQDLDGKVEKGSKRRVVFFKAPINEELGGPSDERKKYGVHFDEKGQFIVDPKKHKNLDFEIVD